MTRREYVLNVWLPEHGTWIALASGAPGAGAHPRPVRVTGS